jgi:ligand-binding sensor domain-containing protein/signal transduction histidine kinase
MADRQRENAKAGGKGVGNVSSYLGVCLVLVFLAQPAFGQPWVSGRFISRAWTTSDGLPNDSVTSILQSRDGFLWIGTQGGLARFDGVAFRKIPFPGAGAANTWVTDLCEDSGGGLYVGTEDGLFYFGENRLTRLAGSVDSVTSLVMGSGNDLWVGTRKGLLLWNGGRFRWFTAADGLPEEPVVSVFGTRSGTLWITLHSGVYQMTDGKIERYHLTPESQSRSPEFLGVYEDREHQIWAFGDTYLIRLPEGKRFNYFHSGHIPSARIWSFREGRDGRLWIGTSGQGLFQFTDERFRPVEMQSGKRPSNVRCISEDFEGNLWLGTDGGGLVQLRQEQLRHLGAAEGLPSSSALCIVEQSPNNLLISYADGSLFSGVRDHFEPYRLLDPTETQPFGRSLCSTPAGDIWIASWGLGLSCLHDHRRIGFSSADGLSANFIAYTCASPDGIVWAGTRSGSIYSYREGRWGLSATVDAGVTALQTQGKSQLWIGTSSGSVWGLDSSNLTQVLSSNSVPGAYVSCLAMDPAGRVWAGSYGAGLRCYNPVTCRTWTPTEEMPDAYICCLVFDKSGNLWVTTPRGILLGSRQEMELASKTLRPLHWRWIAHLDYESNPAPGGPTTLLSRDGLLWVLVDGRVMVLDPRGALGLKPPKPVYIESVRVNGAVRDLAALGRNQNSNVRERITPSVRSLEFEFTSPCLTLPERARFRYKLEAFDADWIEGNSLLRRARYGAIPPGDYTFRVAACDADGTWSKADASFAFLVPTPLWRTRSAIFLYLATLAGTVYMAARVISHRRLRRRLLTLEHSEEMSRERMRIAQDMHDEIGSKLARISYLVEGVKTELKGIYANIRIVDALAKTSRDLLRSLDQMVWAVNPRNDSLEQLALYLCRHATDFFQDTAILCELQVPENLPSAPLSAEIRHNLLLAFEEVLTNAMKHSAADRIVVKISCETACARIEVSDNGHGFNPDNLPDTTKSRNVRVGHGIPGLKRRLQALGGECQIGSSVGHGTRILLQIPLTVPPSL